MRSLKKRLFAFALAAFMLFSATACGDASSSSGTESTGGEGIVQENTTKEVTPITLYPSAANISSGTVGGWRGDLFASLGFELEIWAHSDERTNAILSSGDLPDVMYISADNLDVMIEGGMLLNLDDYLEDMPKLQAYEPIQTALNYVRGYRSAGTGSVYALPTVVGDNSSKYGVSDSTERNAVKLLWDVYEEIGAPEINDIWELIDVMEQMLEARPFDEDGTPYYGTVLNNGSDSTYWACMTMIYRWMGYTEYQLPYLLEIDMAGEEIHSILDEGSLYYEGLKWYNEVYNRGLMDPDSINNDRATQKVKVDNGYAMVPSGYLPGWAPQYYEYYIPDTNIYFSYSSVYGSTQQFYVGINAQTENVEACLAFLDMLCDPDAYLELQFGPDGGGFWYSDENGNAFFTEEALEVLRVSDSTGYPLNNGETLEIWNTPFVINNGAETNYGDGEGGKRIVSTTYWKENVEILSDNETYQQWQQTTGYETWKDWLAEEDAFYDYSLFGEILVFCSQPDDSMQLIIDALCDTIVTASWKMVYAETEAEFESIWEQMVSDCNGLGAQDVIDWRMADIENAAAISESLNA